MAEINLTGQRTAMEGNFNRVKLEHEARYPALCTNVSVRMSKNFRQAEQLAAGKADAPDRVPMIAFEFAVDGKGTVSLEATPKVTKGSTGKDGKVFSNSTLYNVAEKLNLLGALAATVEGMPKDHKFTDAELAEFFAQNMAGKKYEIEAKNRKLGEPNEYSVVGKIVRAL